MATAITKEQETLFSTHLFLYAVCPLLKTILEAGLAAPSGCNKQTTSLIAIDDPVLLEQLKAEIDPPIARTAPAFIAVLTQKIYAYRDKCFQVQDYSAAIENMLLAI